VHHLKILLMIVYIYSATNMYFMANIPDTNATIGNIPAANPAGLEF
jgi:hypothetical protein